MWKKLLETLVDDPDYEWLMIDASHCNAIRQEYSLIPRYCSNQVYRALAAIS